MLKPTWRVLLGAAMIALGPLVIIAQAQGLAPFSGHFVVEDRQSEVGHQTYMGIIVNGAIAQSIYKALRGEPKKDPCTGGLMKADGKGMMCLKYESGEQYECSFGYYFDERRITNGPLSC